METKNWAGYKAVWKEWSNHIAGFYVVDIEEKMLGRRRHKWKDENQIEADAESGHLIHLL